MKQTTELSTLVAGMVSEVVTGVIIGFRSARRHYYGNLLLVAIVAMGITLAIVFRDSLPSISVTFSQNALPAPANTRDQKPEPTPRAHDKAEDLRRQIRPNPL